MRPPRKSVAEILALRGKRPIVMLRVESLDEAAAAEAAGIDIVSVPPALLIDPRYREVAPTLFSIPGLDFFDVGTSDDFVRWAFSMLKASADAIYCSASNETVRRLASEYVPVCGHVGLIPSRRTWTGGYVAVGKTLESAQLVWRQVRALEEAGAFAAEIEVVPEPIAAAIMKKTSLLLISMGAGTGGHAQYLFADDVLGQNTGHVPRHSKIYRNFNAEYDRLQRERVAAFKEYAADVNGGAYPEERHKVPVTDEVVERFSDWLEGQ
ncbi:MAG TPA: 3-methyl-2-oxobutanoate hydroxymethyltransferase [Rhizobiaceae bacterium]|nr:3-methyl-2-oxobutanoate hydroxymethyltransferase [Rhizobiaceae bacterium]